MMMTTTPVNGFAIIRQQQQQPKVGTTKTGTTFSHNTLQQSNNSNNDNGAQQQQQQEEEDDGSLPNANLICTFDNDDFDGNVGDWPYEEKDFLRLDMSNDSKFYNQPKLVTHIDDNAILSLTQYYNQIFEEYYKSDKNGKRRPIDILDICSSWISHYPTTTSESNGNNLNFKYGNVVGLGMNEEELKVNKQLSSYTVQDLNVNPNLDDYNDESFDFITCVVSIDYLIQPQIIFQEIYRLLRPGGSFVISFSNRMFATKAINIWLQADDIGRLTLIGSFFHYTANWSIVEAYDLRPKVQTPARPSPTELITNPSLGMAWMNSVTAINKLNSGDPMYLVRGMK